MKNDIFNLKYIVLLSILILFSNCNQINLTNIEAESLIIKTLNLPAHFNTNINAATGVNGKAWEDCEKLEQAGLIHKNGSWIEGYKLHYTEKAKPFLINEKSDGLGTNTLTFKIFDIDFNSIDGIAINKDQQTATIRFSLKTTNVTPIGKITEKNIESPKNGEFLFKKFDNGWQLASDQNKSSNELLQEIIWPKRN